jgi:hypothetical protein
MIKEKSGQYFKKLNCFLVVWWCDGDAGRRETLVVLLLCSAAAASSPSLPVLPQLLVCEHIYVHWQTTLNADKVTPYSRL